MSWTIPKTWTVGEPLTAGDMNTHLRDNLLALKQRPSAAIILDETSNYATTSAYFVDVDPAKLSLTIETTGGDVLVGLVAYAYGLALWDLTVDGARQAGGDGLLRGLAVSGYHPLTFVWMLSGLAAGVHQVRLQWRSASGTAYLYAGDGAAGLDLHPQFWLKEL